MTTFEQLFEKPYRYRNALFIIKLAVILYCFVSLADAKVILFLAFRVRVSCKTIYQWSTKFPVNLPKKEVKYNIWDTVIFFADEKYIWIRGVQAYWWSIRDNFGNVLACVVTMSRDSESAKELFRRAKARITGRVHAVVHDGLASYESPVGWVFGRKCLSIVAGIKCRPVIINNKLFWITNNSSESFNAEIDRYFARHQYNFNSLESAQQFADIFLSCKNLKGICS